MFAVIISKTAFAVRRRHGLTRRYRTCLKVVAQTDTRSCPPHIQEGSCSLRHKRISNYRAKLFRWATRTLCRERGEIHEPYSADVRMASSTRL